jgi:hypothetical protein
MVGRPVLAGSQAIVGVVEPKLVDLLALPGPPMAPRAQRRRTLGKPMLPVEPRDCSDRSSEPLLSSSWPFPHLCSCRCRRGLLSVTPNGLSPGPLRTRSDRYWCSAWAAWASESSHTQLISK